MKEAECVPGYQFASDNTAGVCPEALATLTEANVGAAASYGDDQYTAQVANRLREVFECYCEVFFVFNGTAANSLAISACCAPYHSVICCEFAHLETDECGGPEFFSGGAKILLAGSLNGKLNPECVEELVTKRTDIHHPKPRVLSITQPSELGTLYSLEELARLCETAHRFGLRVHMDGARLANAIAAMNASPSELTWKAGVDLLCLGGAKLGLAIGEAVVFFDTQLAADFAYRCKQAGQLASKMRFLTAPWLGILNDSAWLRHAAHANYMAQLLAQGLQQISGVRLLYPVEANAVFATLPTHCHQQLAALGWHYYTFVGQGGARFMCSWSTTERDVDALLTDIGNAMHPEINT
jgi:threonine aldolase